MNTPWIQTSMRKQSRLRLFCFPYAGGGASIYRLWSRFLPPEVEVCAIQLPGRENRFREPLYTHILPLVAELKGVVRPYLNLPYMFFGHSLGARIAFELARDLRRQQLPEPRHFFVSGNPAPQLPHRVTIKQGMPEAEFREALLHLGGTPEAVLHNEELMDVMSPILRADFSLYENYIYAPEPPLAYPITAFSGEEDPEASAPELLAWREQTSSTFEQHLLPGNHFFIHSHQELLLQKLTPYLR